MSDKNYDVASKMLFNMQREQKKADFEKTQYYYVFYDYDGNTGFGLFERLKEDDRKKIKAISESLLRNRR